MTPIRKLVLFFLALCLVCIASVSGAHSARALKHFHRLIYAGRNENYNSVIAEYNRLPIRMQNQPRVKSYYDEAVAKHGKHNQMSPLLPGVDHVDIVAAFGGMGIMILMCGIILKSKERQNKSLEGIVNKRVSNGGTYSAIKVKARTPTEAQIRFIKRMNKGIVPLGLTRDEAAKIINRFLERMSEDIGGPQLDLSPGEMMTSSETKKKQMKLERERRRAAASVARRKEQEARKAAQETRRLEREAIKAKKAEDKLYDKRIAEEEKLLKAREDSNNGVVKKAKTEKAKTIQEFQNFVNGILADKVIDPQEVRQLKAWLIANKRSQNDFDTMLKLIDETLADGIIDENETQLLYEGIIDCLIALRGRI